MDGSRAKFRVSSGRRIGAITDFGANQQVRRASLRQRIGVHVSVRQCGQEFRDTQVFTRTLSRVERRSTRTLANSLDAKKNKPGDRVEARTTQDVKQDGKVVLKKGTHLVGHVTQAQAREGSSHNHNSESCSITPC